MSRGVPSLYEIIETPLAVGTAYGLLSGGLCALSGRHSFAKGAVCGGYQGILLTIIDHFIQTKPSLHFLCDYPTVSLYCSAQLASWLTNIPTTESVIMTYSSAGVIFLAAYLFNGRRP